MPATHRCFRPSTTPRPSSHPTRSRRTRDMAPPVEIKVKGIDLFYVTIDGTKAIDSLAIGQLWQSFGWKNLLTGMTAPAADPQRRNDTAHPNLPIRFMSETQQLKSGNTFADVVIMPEGRDGSGIDAG